MRLSLLNRRLALALSLMAAACKKDAPIPAGREPAPAAAAETIPVRAYPHARWRLANSSELDHVVLWASQILIRYEGANPDPAFAMADWHSRSSGGQRSRAEALKLARALREQAAKEPARFAELASRHSEEVTAPSLGGSIGGISASQLVFWPTVLDALAATRAGEVSEVVETLYGFHILLRRAPPPEDTVSGAHLVIAHQEAGWIQILGRKEAPKRSRDEALALAKQLYEKAKEKPEEFAALVEQYSDHRDAERGGDMGTWSTREPTFYPREVEILGGLPVGGVAAPVDSPVGFQVIQRTPNRSRERYAMDEIRLFFDPTRFAPDPSSQAAVSAKATEVALKLRTAPSRFDGFRKELCCSYSEQWEDGRGSPAVTDALSRLKPGQIAPEPIKTELSYVIAKRVEPPARDPVSVRFDLPEPSAPDVNALIRSHDNNFLREELGRVGDEVLAQMRLSEEAARRVTDLHGAERFKSMDTPELRSEAFTRLLSDVKQALPPDMYPLYLKLVDAHFAGVLLASQ